MRDLFKIKVIEPILRLKPHNVSIDDFLAIIFNLNSRIITTYLVKYKFVVPGLYMINDTIPTQGMGERYRDSKRGDMITARVDDHNPNEIHVELKSKVFLLNRFEWNSIKDCLSIRKGYEEI